MVEKTSVQHNLGMWKFKLEDNFKELWGLTGGMEEKGLQDLGCIIA